jgi:hypothetical protein
MTGGFHWSVSDQNSMQGGLGGLSSWVAELDRVTVRCW